MLTNLRHLRQRMRPLFAATRNKMIALGLSSFFGGLAEALVLLLVIKAALVIAAGERIAEIHAGPIRFKLEIGALLGISLAVALVRLALQAHASHVAARISTEVITRTRAETFGDFMDASWDLQAKEEEGYLQDLMNRHVTRTSSAVLNISTGLNALFNFLALFASALALNLPAAAMIVVAVLAMFVVLRPITKKARHFSMIQSDAGRDYAKTMVETVGITMEVRTFGVIEPVKRKMQALSLLETEPYFRAQFLGRLLPALYQTAAILVLLGGMVIVHVFVQGQLASLAAIVLILVRALNYSEVLQVTYHRVAEVMPFADRLEEERRRFRESAVTQTGLEVDKLRELGFEHVRFQYTPDRVALDDVSFTLPAGEAIGLVGPSGSGKSTLVQLLLRLRVPTSGRFLVNGEDARQQDIVSWYRRIAFVPQDSRLLSTSVAENIRFFREDIDDAAIERAAKLAHIHDDITSWPQGYQTMVGPRGNAVSGGQRQRISLARALVAQPDLIVLDEPTSALDMQSEALVHETLADLKGKVTLIVIAHRLSTLNICDRIIVLGNGKLQAFDHRERLEAENVFYREALELSRMHGQPAKPTSG